MAWGGGEDFAPAAVGREKTSPLRQRRGHCVWCGQRGLWRFTLVLGEASGRPRWFGPEGGGVAQPGPPSRACGCVSGTPRPSAWLVCLVCVRGSRGRAGLPGTGRSTRCRLREGAAASGLSRCHAQLLIPEEFLQRAGVGRGAGGSAGRPGAGGEAQGKLGLDLRHKGVSFRPAKGTGGHSRGKKGLAWA